MNEPPISIARRLEQVRSRLHAAERAAERRPDSVQLIAVSKTQPVAALMAAYRQGQRDFGENYLQEALGKQRQLAHLDIGWHFIGPIQSNKTRPLAEYFDWVHGVDRLKIAERLSEQRPAHRPPLNICLQYNVSGEASKSGVDASDLPDLAVRVSKLPGLRLRGLMAIPAPGLSLEQQRATFTRVRVALESLRDIAGLDTLSMGMSEDLEAAVLEGSTLVRIGTAIFGSRNSVNP